MTRAWTWAERMAMAHRRRHPYEVEHLAGSLAADAARAHQLDRVERARERVVAFSDGRHPALEAELRDMYARFQRDGDVVPEVFARIRDHVISQIDPARCLREPRRVLVRTTEDDSVNAIYRPFEDGTGLIQVCEGLCGLVGLLSKQLVVSAGVEAGLLPLLTDAAYAAGSASAGRGDTYSYAIDVSVLRWTLLHQRFYGTASSVHRRLEPDAERVVDSINLRAMQFVVAHECAHHYLGHPAPRTGDVGDIALENEADEAALDSLDLDGHFGTTDALGALVAVLALRCFGAVTAVRGAHTHPDPQARSERVLDRLSRHRRAIVLELMSRVRAVTDRACDLDHFVDASWWKTMMESPTVRLAPRIEGDVQQVFEIDRLATGPLVNADRLLTYLDRTHGLGLLSVAESLKSSSWTDALADLSVRERSRPAIVDRDRPLSFSQLLRESTNGLSRLGLEEPTSRFSASMTMARIIEQRVREESTDEGR